MISKIRSALSVVLLVPGGRWRTVVLALAFLLFFFALGFRLFFPVDALKQRLESEVSRQTGAQVELQRLSLGLPLSLKLHDLQVDSRQPPLPALRADLVELSPGWLSLVSGDPKIDVVGELYAGELFLNLARSGRFSLELDDLRLERLPAAPLFETPLKLGGTLSGRINAPEPPLSKGSDTAIELSIDNAIISGLEPLGIAAGRIDIGDVLAKGILKGRRLEIQTLKAAGGDMGVDGEGNLLIGASPARSRLNLQITLQPEDGLDPMLRDLLSLSGSKPGADGSYRFRLSGSLARPVLR